MAAAFEELSHYQEFDYIIVNDNFDDALAQMREILDGRGAEYLKSVQLPGLQGLIEDLLPQKMP
jgi:guanylate kinase